MAKCISQIRVRHGDQFHDVPCGRCNYCLQNRRKEWSFRLQKELRQHESAYFLTLTYHDLAVPTMEVKPPNWNELDRTDFQSVVVPVLRKEDFQKFMKRLRKRHAKYTSNRVKYYAVGEYGSNTARPHYHCVCFGLHPKVISHIGTIWTDGFVHVGAVNNDSIDYITKYVINKYDFADYPVPPFALISNGIGLGHFNQNSKLYKNADTVCNNRGYKQVVPRYYRTKLDRNQVSEDLRKAKNAVDFAQREQTELCRLTKLHPDPHSYIIERQVANHDRIAKQSKKGDVL